MTERNDDETQAFDPFASDETRAIRPPTTPRGPDVTAPVTERIAIADRPSIAGWLIALIAIVALAAGAGLGYSQSDGDRDGVVAQALVGPDGGVLEFGSLGRLEIPAGALPTATGITVRRVTNENRVRIGSGSDASTDVHDPGTLELYAFEPAGLSFQQPVTITLPRPSDGSSVLIDTPDGLRVVAPDETTSATVTFTTDGFDFRDR